VTELGFPDQVTALGGRAIDAAVTTEPFVTRIVDGGLGTLYQRNDVLFPSYQIAEVIYGARFAQEQPEVGRRFMIAYLRAVRFYNDAFVKGDAAARQAAIATLTRHTTVRDPALYESMVMGGLHPDGRINLASLAEDQELWLARGIQQQRLVLEDIIDYSFADAAVQALGPYQ
jgi:NitT/TauT family transport system substrate-binding protein